LTTTGKVLQVISGIGGPAVQSLGGESQRDALKPLPQMNLPEKLRKTGFGSAVKSTLGYKIIFNNRSSVTYIDKYIKIFIAVDGLSDSRSRVLYPNYMTIGSPKGPLLMDDRLRKLVLERVRGAGQFSGRALD
jgi:hypothetical protein